MDYNIFELGCPIDKENFDDFSKMDFIRNIINEWDPICLFPMAPENEYEDEIAQIYHLLRKGKLQRNYTK